MLSAYRKDSRLAEEDTHPSTGVASQAGSGAPASGRGTGVVPTACGTPSSRGGVVNGSGATGGLAGGRSAAGRREGRRSGAAGLLWWRCRGWGSAPATAALAVAEACAVPAVPTSSVGVRHRFVQTRWALTNEESQMYGVGFLTLIRWSTASRSCTGGRPEENRLSCERLTM